MDFDYLNFSGEVIEDESILDESQRELNGLRRWEKRFRSEALADNCALFRSHLRRLGLPEKPGLLLEGTISVMQATWVFANLDGVTIKPFLAMQHYDPTRAINARYAVTFDLCGKAFARVLVDSLRNPPLDLADLFNYPWVKYRTAGFESIWISHLNWSPLTIGEIKQLEQDVADDLLFDYTENEINFWFDEGIDPACLFVSVNDK